MWIRSRLYVADSMTTFDAIGHVNVDNGVTVNDAFVRPFRTGNVSEVSTWIVSRLFAACDYSGSLVTSNLLAPFVPVSRPPAELDLADRALLTSCGVDPEPLPE